jgi:hypothetical protein
MHNYLKTLGTKPIRVRLTLRPITENGNPFITVEVGDSFYISTDLDETLHIDTSIELMEELFVSVALTNKKYDSDKETAIVIEEFMIDDFSVLPNYTSHAVYSNDRNFSEPTNYLGFNGIWIFKLTEPFYHWRHKVTGQGWLLEP